MAVQIVARLMRVSSRKQHKRQADNDIDLPTQRQRIMEFIGSKSDWISKPELEYTEVESAFKKGADERDILQDVLRDAANGKFNTLVVFKADRLSRKSEEYPFVLAMLKRHGVEVWSGASFRRES
jgi:site-specific DNA recombinase